MGLLDFLLNLNDEEKDDTKEQEMEWNKFSEREKEEFKNGDYDIYNFEDSEDELDEDDYYYDK